MKIQRKSIKSKKPSKKRFTWVIPANRGKGKPAVASNCDCSK